MNQAGKLIEAQKAYGSLENSGGEGEEVSSNKDNELHEAFHNRAFNPIDQAARGTVSEKLNEAAGRYRKGPGPV